MSKIAEEYKARQAEKAAALKDPNLHGVTAPAGYTLTGVSTFSKNENGDPVWIKTKKDKDSPQAFLDMFREAIAAEPLKAKDRTKAPKALNADLCSVYPIGDAHIGMLSWGVETGADFDMKIAEANLVQATNSLAELSPPAERCILINVGDFFHTDSTRNETTSGTRLDADSRWGKMLQVGLRVKIACIDACLSKHKIVTVIVNPGNHDTHSAWMLSISLQHHYRNEPRVIMSEIPRPYTYEEFGKNLLGTTHGNLCKLDALPAIMAADQREAWGRTTNRHFYVGHFHHSQVKEHRGCTVETVRTLAAADQWHHASGYRAGRSMMCDVWHKTRGRIVRHEIGIEEIEALAALRKIA